MSRSLKTPILIVGGGTGGVAAALAVAEAGQHCIVTEFSDWIGGQLTTQAVPPDENRWIEGEGDTVGGTASYCEFRESVRRWYRENRPLTPTARRILQLNPGGGWVSRLCFEPCVGHVVLRSLLAPHIETGRIQLLLRNDPVAADTVGDHIRSVTFRNCTNDQRITIEANYVLDATELGDLYPMTQVEYAVGAEHRDVHGELHGRTDHSDPMDQQAVTWCFAMEHRPGEDHTIDKPQGYTFWRDYVPPMVDKAWPGPMFSWTVEGNPQPRHLPMVPWPDEPCEDQLDLWRYRRIIDRSLYNPKAPLPEVTSVNWPQMDYFLRPTVDVGPQAQALAFAEAKQLSLAFFYWMQTEAPRHDSATKTGYPGLKLFGEAMGTEDGFAKAVYVREARRLNARTVVCEAHVGHKQRQQAGHPAVTPIGTVAGEPFADSIGVGHYWLDLHPSSAMRGSIYIEAAPFRIPLGAIIPVRVRNLLAAGKNLGVTHITNGCYRLHPVEWNVGEAAGLLAAHCLQEGLEPHAVHERPQRVCAFQRRLIERGVCLSWPWEPALDL